MDKLKPNFYNGIVIPEDTTYGNIMALVEHINNEGFKCEMFFIEQENRTIPVLTFETKEKAVEAKLKYG